VATDPSPESLLGDFALVHWGLTFWNLNKHHWFIMFHISIRGAWSFVLEGRSPPKPPSGDGTVWKTSACLCNWLGKVKLCDMPSLQDVSNFLLMSMTGFKESGATHTGSVYSVHEAKPVQGLLCLHLNTMYWSGHVTSAIRRDNCLGFKSLWLGCRIKVMVKVYGQILGLVVQCLELGFSLQFA